VLLFSFIRVMMWQIWRKHALLDRSKICQRCWVFNVIIEIYDLFRALFFEKRSLFLVAALLYPFILRTSLFLHWVVLVFILVLEWKCRLIINVKNAVIILATFRSLTSPGAGRYSTGCIFLTNFQISKSVFNNLGLFLNHLWRSVDGLISITRILCVFF